MGNSKNSPIKIIDYQKFYTGTIWNSKKAGKLIVEDYQDRFHVKVRFLETGYETVAIMDNVRAGSVKDPYHVLNCGGYFGEGNFKAGANIKIYKVWENMLRRAYIHQNSPSHVKYENCSVVEEWRNFQVFAEWYSNYLNQINPFYHDCLQLDKDILQWGIKNKVYSPSLCCLIPDKLNKFLGTIYYQTKMSNYPVGVRPNNNKFSVYISEGDQCRKYYGSYPTKEEAFLVYKNEKENQIRSLADYYYKENAITENVYLKLMSIEIFPYKEE